MTGKRAKRLALLVLLVGAGLGMLAWSQPWASASLADGGTHEVPGSQASPETLALAMTALAGVVALAIAGRVLRLVVGALMVIVGILMAATVFPYEVAAVSLEPLADAAVTQTFWPILAVVAGVVIALSGMVALATGRTWPSTDRKYSTSRMQDAAAPADDASTRMDQWDALSAGDDPTEEAESESPDEPETPRAH
ncbi:hypothetical protein EG850_05540 [Gulosibacter macacae]|uniref:Uncharacterized protein n=1 Tax=Gulosibacter macacae TaxID=2488791 RepID=A0A3P3VX47_9MICO|nr:Trp biosynthesis-associated membrane protein [Gulosibacter macacae]RRJ87270.1 hypothetical protein EG850_05540 [Gulosibacter macacae]